MTEPASERARPSRRPRCPGRRGPLLALLLVAALLAALEGGLRLLGWHERTDFFQFETQLASGTDSEQHVFHESRFYGLAPRYVYNAAHAGRYATGTYAGRGRPPLPAPPGMARVVVAGDSCVYGYGVDVAQSLPEELARALATRGWGPDRVQVLNRGTNGYSTVQIDLAVEEALALWQPDVVVLYPAAWNDQSPAMGLSDLALIDSRRDPDLRQILEQTASFNALRALLGKRRAVPELDRDEITRLWEAGDAPYGLRVPAEAVEPQVARTLARIAAAGARAVVVVPAHPPATLSDHPRTGADAEAVARAARAAGVALIDGPALLEPLVRLGDGRAFLDFVHPTPPALERLAEALADPVAEALGAAPARAVPPESAGRAGDVKGAGQPFAIRRVTPERVPALGDVRVTVELDGWSRPPGDPARALAVVVGGAPLLDLAWVGEDAVAGTLPANTAGRRDVVVQTADACAWLSQAIELEAPRFVFEPGSPPRIALESRPGDRGFVVVGVQPVDPPRWKAVGAERIDRETALFAGAVGAEPLVLSQELVDSWPDRVLLQGLVQPRGTEGEGAPLRMSGVTVVRVRGAD